MPVRVVERVDLNSGDSHGSVAVERGKDFAVPAGLRVESTKAVRGVVLQLSEEQPEYTHAKNVRYRGEKYSNCVEHINQYEHWSLICFFESVLPKGEYRVPAGALAFRTEVLPSQINIGWSTVYDVPRVFSTSAEIGKLFPNGAGGNPLRLVDAGTGEPAQSGPTTLQADAGPDRYTYVTLTVKKPSPTPSVTVSASTSPSATVSAPASPSASVPATASASSSPVAAGAGSGGGDLPLTGSNIALFGGAGVLLIGLGAVAFLVARRRRTEFTA